MNKIRSSLLEIMDACEESIKWLEEYYNGEFTIELAKIKNIHPPTDWLLWLFSIV